MRLRPRPVAAKGGVAVAATTLALAGVACQAPGVHRASQAPAADARPSAIVLGHRGACAYAPENTLASIDMARQLGVTWVENDVQRTKDGHLVVIHDATLARTTDARQVYPDRAPWNVSDLTLAQIEKLDAGSWFSSRYAGERVPTLDRYLARVERNRQNLLLEIKEPRRYPGIERQIADTLRRDGWLDQDHVARRLIVQSFSATSLAAFHRLLPQVTTGLLGNPPVSELKRDAAFADQINPDGNRVPPGYFAAVHAVRGPHGRPMRAFAWIVNDPRTAVRLTREGADGIITNKPDVMRKALAAVAAPATPKS
ncbi:MULTISPECIES: glycerophosphodiester phosphodiesterase [Streptomycetaceae]|uniref:Secreted hydrolase n=1 Tax=Streptantibioticus cattleyicolor (strain ATCC 35852 / DSM 46488 / JCM 4925 / NBRC 14057 / NRRL 8057) TaxID=1003195 RepID=F8JVW6_STREN|nr:MULTISPECIES: glycerophosphodiester phosphodiesterase family protein [Streptomycetaceae]AEW92447.1 secreted hydrolase [Streptantibioticus cattleyicolor NRRL 8057 = DSM 46488]MYS57254.1 glycerophosphodiester phosphodiesterase [Streptomyces sp. SID5468]CCB72811.1 putative secreted hydrolase [Streptantibioticus cattleyicolor NRRL 8057 = DSM 46488]